MSDIALKELKPVGRQERLGDLAYQSMKEKLIRGAFEPGRKLTVRAVAEALGVSSTPARDALNRLSSEGALVYSGPKTVIVPFLTADALQEITLMRLSLEGLAADRAVLHAEPELVDKLESIQELIVSALTEGRYHDSLHHNKEFHFAIYREAHMPHLLMTIEALWLRIGASFNHLYPEFAQTKFGVHNHMSAMEGLREKDGPAVRAAMENDIRDGYRRLKGALFAQNSQ